MKILPSHNPNDILKLMVWRLKKRKCTYWETLNFFWYWRRLLIELMIVLKEIFVGRAGHIHFLIVLYFHKFIFAFSYISRRKYWFCANFQFPVFDGFTHFGMSWVWFHYFCKMSVCIWHIFCGCTSARTIEWNCIKFYF